MWIPQLIFIAVLVTQSSGSSLEHSRCKQRESFRCRDPCRSKPCEHTCTASGTTYTCSCNSGYKVKDVTKCVADPCHSKPCEHTCTASGTTYTCSCNSGYKVKDVTKCVPEVVDACKTSPTCEHDCTVLPNGNRKCSCRSGFAVNSEDPNLCDVISICTTKADVIMVFDASNSIGIEHFDKQFIFAKKLIKNFKIGLNDVLFGSVVYSLNVLTLFNLKDNKDYASLDKALTGVKYMNSATETGKALNHVTQQTMFDAVNGGRADAPNILVLFTDGAPRYLDEAIAAAQTLKNNNVLIIGVGIGSALDMNIVRQLSSTPEDALEATSYDMLEYIEKRLTELLCTRRE